MKNLMIEIWNILNSIIKRIPLTYLRVFIYKSVSHIGSHSYIAIKVTMRSPKHIYIGHNTIINKIT